MHLLFCLGAGHVKFFEVVTVDVFGQLAGAAWSTIVPENLITRLAGFLFNYFLVQASRVGIQCLTPGVSLQTL